MPNQDSVQNFLDMDAETYLEKRVDNQLKWMDGKSKSNKNYYRVLKFVVILLSVSIPFLVSFIKAYPYFTYIVGGVGVLIAGIEGILSLYNFQNNWLNYRSTSEALYREKFLFATKSGFYKESENPFIDFVERAEAILDSENKSWAKFSSSQASVPKAKKG